MPIEFANLVEIAVKVFSSVHVLKNLFDGVCLRGLMDPPK